MFIMYLGCGLHGHYRLFNCICDDGWTGTHCESSLQQQQSTYNVLFCFVLEVSRLRSIDAGTGLLRNAP